MKFSFLNWFKGPSSSIRSLLKRIILLECRLERVENCLDQLFKMGVSFNEILSRLSALEGQKTKPITAPKKKVSKVVRRVK